jgi:hypothetical protein
MSTPRFIEWLDEKMANYEKLIPPEEVLLDELDQRIEENVRSKVMDRILREAGFEDQVAAAIFSDARVRELSEPRGWA